MNGKISLDIPKILRIIGIIIAIVILIVSTFIWFKEPAIKESEVQNTTQIKTYGQKTYNQAMKDNKPCFVMFHAKWCSYCKNFMPLYQVLSEAYKGKYNFVMVDGENPENLELTLDYVIGSYPTIYIVDPTIDNRILISNTIYNSKEKLSAELDRYLRIRAMIHK